MNSVNTKETRVYLVELRASFYVLATDSAEAEDIANVLHPISNIDIELPARANPRYAAHAVLNNSDEIRARCENV